MAKESWGGGHTNYMVRRICGIAF